MAKRSIEGFHVSKSKMYQQKRMGPCNRQKRKGKRRDRSKNNEAVKNCVDKYSGKSILASEPCCGLLMRWPRNWRFGS